MIHATVGSRVAIFWLLALKILSALTFITKKKKLWALTLYYQKTNPSAKIMSLAWKPKSSSLNHVSLNLKLLNRFPSALNLKPLSVSNHEPNFTNSRRSSSVVRWIRVRSPSIRKHLSPFFRRTRGPNPLRWISNPNLQNHSWDPTLVIFVESQTQIFKIIIFFFNDSRGQTLDSVYLTLKPSIHMICSSHIHARFKEEDEIDDGVQFRIVALIQVHRSSIYLVFHHSILII